MPIVSPMITNDNGQESDNTYACPSWIQNGIFIGGQAIEGKVLGWINAAIEEGTAYLKNCRAYEDLERALELVIGNTRDERLPDYQSNVFVNVIKRDIRETVAILSNIRQSWRYDANSDRDDEYKAQARVLNGLSTAWYNSIFLRKRFLRTALQHASVQGTGYLSPFWNPHYWGYNQGDIDLKVFGYSDVLPIQIGRDFDLQKAYAVIIRDEVGINRARDMFPEKAHLIHPDRGASRYSKGLVTTVETFWNSWFGDSKKNSAPSPVVDIFYTYIDDRTVNATGYTIGMGKIKSQNPSWAYDTPSLGDQIPAGYDIQGNIISRRASGFDARLFPNRRLVISTRNVILYDGPSYWWHGKVPAIKLSVDEWAWDYLGYSLATRAIMSMQNSATQLRRGIEDAINLQMDPPMNVDSQVSKAAAESFSLRQPGAKLRGPQILGDFAKPSVPPNSYRVDSWYAEYVAKVEEEIGNQIGLPGLKSLQQAKQVPSSDSIEKFFAQAGSIVTDISQGMDSVIWELADMNRYLFFQFYDFSRRVKVLGHDGVTEEDLDYEPGQMIPGNLPNEPPMRGENGVRLDGVFSSTQTQRAKAHVANFRTHISPTSLHAITHMQRKLLFLQASKISPFLVSLETLAEQLDIPNWGHLEGDTELEKTISFIRLQEQLKIEAAIRDAGVQGMLQSAAESMTPEGQAAGALGQIGELMGGASQGRPPSFTGAPQLKSKDGGTRTTVETSAPPS